MSDFRTPLAKVRGNGSAKEGTSHFWRQRLTAIALIPLSIWFGVSVLGVIGAHEASTLAFLSQPLNAILMAAFVVILLFHMILGLQVIIDDYIRRDGQKLFLMLLIRAFAIAAGAVSIFALLRIAGPL